MPIPTSFFLTFPVYLTCPSFSTDLSLFFYENAVLSVGSIVAIRKAGGSLQKITPSAQTE
jgi:hypothetical protein